MLIQIESGDAKSPRKVRVEPDDGKPVEFTASSLGEAHRLLKQGRMDGWETITPEALAAQTRAETAKEKARVEAGKKAAEPKAK